MSRQPSPSDPFHTYRPVTARSGALYVAQAGPPPNEADAVVLALHGITSSHVAFRATARELGTAAPGLCLLAPDLRGRGRSALPGPYGFAQHTADLLAVLDDAGVERVVVAGHSMGGYAAARLAADHPDRIAALVLVDGGLVVPLPQGDPQELLRVGIEQATSRLRMTFQSVDEYVELWRHHPALLGQWNDDVHAYARYDVTGQPGNVRCVVSSAAVAADLEDMTFDEPTQTAVDRVRAPIRLVRAQRGLFDDDPVLADPVVEAFVATHPEASVEMVEGTNHYTLIFAEPGPQRIAAATLASVPAFQ